jgi:hypothetical protein
MNLFFRLTVVLGIAVGAGFEVAPAMAQDARVAEDQTPTGKFLTATEVKPILGATQGNWVAVREWEGNDLIYFTHLLAWRCGLYEIRYSVNGGPQQQWPVPDCDPATHTPGAIPDGAEIYATVALKSVQTIDVELLYDDLSTQSAQFERAAIQIQ